MTFEEKINNISSAKFTRIDGPIMKVYCLDDEKFDPNLFCNEIERAYNHRGEDVLEVLKYCITGKEIKIPEWYRNQIVNDIIKLDNLLVKFKGSK